MNSRESTPVDPKIYEERLVRVRQMMSLHGVDSLMLSVGHDLPYLTGYHAMPLERLTMLVVPRRGDAVMVIPKLEAPRVAEQPGVFTLHPWTETENPVEIVARLSGRAGVAAVGCGVGGHGGLPLSSVPGCRECRRLWEDDPGAVVM